MRDTEYGLGAIPLGGYVKIPGMVRPEAEDLWGVAALLEPTRDPRRPGGCDRRQLRRPVPDAVHGPLRQAGDECSRLRTLVAEAEPHLTETEMKRASAARPRARGVDPGYWRSPRRSGSIVILAGPVMNLAIAFLVLSVVAVTGMPQAAKVTPRVTERCWATHRRCTPGSRRATG